MNLEDLRAVQVDERGSTDLQPLRDSFYRDVAAYIEGLREERERAAAHADDPFGSEEVRRLTDEIETAEEVVEAVYERRVGKVVKRASLAAAGMPIDDEGLTAEEAELFADLVDLIETHRGEVLAALAGEEGYDVETTDAPADEDRTTDAGTADAPPPETGTSDAGFDAGDAMGGSTDSDPDDSAGADPVEEPTPTEEPASADAPDAGERVTVRITRDVGEIFGVDERTYTLSSEDVVALPEANAKPLLERDAAQRL